MFIAALIFLLLGSLLFTLKAYDHVIKSYNTSDNDAAIQALKENWIVLSGGLLLFLSLLLLLVGLVSLTRGAY